MTEHFATFTAEVNIASANNFVSYLQSLAAARATKLNLAMSCPGGNVVNGISIYNMMLAMPYEIICHNIGNVDSIANIIFVGGKVRFASAAATFMFHGVGFNAPANLRMEEKNLKEMLDSVVADHNRLAAVVSARSTLSLADAEQLFRDQRTRDAPWAKQSGLISDVKEYSLPAGVAVQSFA